MKLWFLFVVAALCFVLVPVVSFFVGGWLAYWGHAVLAILFGVVITLIRTVYFWEEE